MDKYRSTRKHLHRQRSKKKMCTEKVPYDTPEQAYQKNQRVYKCKHCGKYHRSGQFQRFVASLSH